MKESSDWKLPHGQHFCPRGGNERDDWTRHQVMRTVLACGHRRVRCEANVAEVSRPVILKSPFIKTERVKCQSDEARSKTLAKLPLRENKGAKRTKISPITIL